MAIIITQAVLQIECDFKALRGHSLYLVFAAPLVCQTLTFSITNQAPKFARNDTVSKLIWPTKAVEIIKVLIQTQQQQEKIA